MSSLFGGTPSVPKVNLTQELQQTLAGYQNTAGGFYGLSQQYSPQYTDLNLNTLAQTLFGSQNAPGEIASQTAAQTAMRGADISDLLNLGPAGYAALMRSNPGLAGSLGLANQNALRNNGPGSLLGSLNNTAQQQLSLGGSISPQEQTQIDQANRAGFAQRGMFNTNQSLASDLLNRDQYSNQRLGQRLGWAQGIQGLNQQNQGGLNQLALTNSQVFNPYSDVLGRSVLGGGSNPLSLAGTLQTQSLFNPTGGADVFNTNFNAQSSAAIAAYNQQNAQQNALIQAAGSIAGAALSDERLKKNIKKVGVSPSGIPIKEFSYKGDKRRFVGVTAQDVEKINPRAIVTMPLTGFKLVDMSKTDAPFFEKIAA